MTSEFTGPVDKEDLLARIRAEVAAMGGKRLGRKRFLEATGWSKWDLHCLFPSWNEALNAAGRKECREELEVIALRDVVGRKNDKARMTKGICGVTME